MKLQIRKGFEKVLGGASIWHDGKKSYGEEIVGLLNTVWSRLREMDVVQNGINMVVYDPDGTVFAGVEVSEADAKRCGLESRKVKLGRYGYFKHVGPYSKLQETCVRMAEELSTMGHPPTQPIVEIYGHWTDDESKLETEILHSIPDRAPNNTSDGIRQPADGLPKPSR